MMRSIRTTFYSLLYVNQRIGFDGLKCVYSVISVIEKRLPGNSKKWTLSAISPFLGATSCSLKNVCWGLLNLNTETPEPLIWIRALQRPPEPDRIKSFFNYWTALLSRIAHSGPRSGWSGWKYVVLLTCQCTINCWPLRAVNCIQETTFRQTPPLSLAYHHEAGPGRMANFNVSMCLPACSKHPHWKRCTNKL